MSSAFPNEGVSAGVLASASKARRALLAAAGLDFEIVPAELDEDAIRGALDDVEPQDLAELLARAKAETVSNDRPDAVVIGADQVLSLGGRVFAKPKTSEAAQRQLLDLQGRTHTLFSAAAIARKGKTIWSHVGSVDLTMRALTPEFIGRYLAAAGPEVLGSVGAYQLEGLGPHLFSRIEGDYFTVLGLPLLRLLEALRGQNLIAG